MKNLSSIIVFVIYIGLLGCRTQEEPPIVKEDLFCLTDTLRNQLQLETVRKAPVENMLEMSGKITYNEDQIVRVFALAGGYVEKITAELGDYVEKGQVLAVIRSPEITSFTSQKVMAESSLRVAEKNYQAAQALFKTGSLSEVELANARKEFENAQSELQKINEILSIYGASSPSSFTIKAPASGFVVAKSITLNMELRADDISPVYTISNIDKVWILANVYESDISKIRSGMDAEIRVISYPKKVYKGKIDKVFNAIDPVSKTMKARITLKNTDFELKPEMFANVRVYYTESEDRLSIPSTSVIFDKNKYFVMVYKSDCDIDTREIKIYLRNEVNTYVLSGLEEGEKVMSKYQLLVYDAIND
ncbi:MAG: efflux RND transporter periplasmic adaptor subunit [Flammeovirgaceae bacterium]|nr:efflux RND transporter periplasmic adaptor subunit [Flammeovirgaceae bacterium]MDW8286648.1 efflux RND transporter periplasmic adaptor subunit [Flammeovirgaceae bacterium]